MTEENTAPVEEKKAPEVVAPAEKSAAPESKPDQRDQRDNRERRPRRGGRDRKPREPKEFEEAILQIDRVTRVVKGGRRMRFRLTVVIGDKKGRVGFGIGKSAEVLGGIQKAVAVAKKNLINVPIVEGTIPHPVNSVFKSSRVLLLPATEGKGVIAGGAVRKILELAGVKDVLSKAHGSRNRLNIANATMQALLSLSKEPNPGKKSVKKEEAPVVPEKTVEEKAEVKKPAEKKIAPVAPKKDETVKN
ncbi:30S ribosomal protein S5 [bacterium]|nr:30S ribosomal protein S5 [bacterium]